MSQEFVVKQETGEEIKLITKAPSLDDQEGADRAYAAKVAELIRQPSKKKLLLRQELDKFLKESGIWTEEDEKHLQSIHAEIDILMKKLRKGGIKLSEGRRICIEITDKRREIIQYMQKRQTFDDTTIEAYAEGEKIDYFVYALTLIAETNERYWPSFEDMKNDKTSAVFLEARAQVFEKLYQTSEFEKSLPEVKWLSKQGYLDTNMNFVDRKTKARVDRTGRPIEEVVKTAIEEVERAVGEIAEETPYIDDEPVETVAEKAPEPTVVAVSTP